MATAVANRSIFQDGVVFFHSFCHRESHLQRFLIVLREGLETHRHWFPNHSSINFRKINAYCGNGCFVTLFLMNLIILNLYSHGEFWSQLSGLGLNYWNGAHICHLIFNCKYYKFNIQDFMSWDFPMTGDLVSLLLVRAVVLYIMIHLAESEEAWWIGLPLNYQNSVWEVTSHLGETDQCLTGEIVYDSVTINHSTLKEHL